MNYSIYAESTPNPAVMKFVSNRILVSENLDPYALRTENSPFRQYRKIRQQTHTTDINYQPEGYNNYNHTDSSSG